MKLTICLSILSVAIIAESGYLVYDHQTRDREQAQLKNSLLERINAAEERAGNSYQQLSASVAQLQDAISGSQSHNEALIASAINQMQKNQQNNETILNAARTQANVALSVVEELKDRALAQLQESQAGLQESRTELTLLKNEQLARTNEADNRWRKHQKPVPEGALND